ncbi:sigma-70 family RNA polymerase sigma factor [Streptomyces halobius]|uniref:Sigma-70 family RNA polymerase sigma factor n=1 Tax=Streptomyces halobius TaxID=2879846 RepID=A0ABY4MHK1_9ACTN|nr:sigma-70 family RNA polymerase sigma factor [Streptomyces halobius]UQA97279.1 sigma-70 family RNA polymerase sigma factor [Streptomyces halobius]
MLDDHAMPASDAELIAALRKSESDAPVDELYRRHRSAVLAYARACCRDLHTAEDLTSEAFARALQAVRTGGGPEAAWRPYLLTIVRRTAADWARTARRTELSPDFEQWLANAPGTPEAESSEEQMLRLEDNSLILRAFRSLPERWQTVLWHTAVEEEQVAKVGTLLGMSASAVSSLASRAREGLREAYLAVHAENGSDSVECRHYSSLLGAAVRRVGRRTNKDLERHLAACERCRSALREVSYLNERLGSALPGGVMLWGASAYGAARSSEAGAHASTATAFGAADTGAAVPHGTGWWAKAKGSPLRSGAVAGSFVAALGAAVLVVPMPFGDGGEEPVYLPPVRAESRPPTIAATPTPTATPTTKPSPTASPTRTTSPRLAAPPPMPSKKPKPSPTLGVLGVARWSGRLQSAQFGGMCVEPAGTTVVQSSCDDGKEQVWQLVAFEEAPHYGWLRNAATGKCIDYTGPVERDKNTGRTQQIRPKTGPCRTDGRGQLFDLAGRGDDSYYVKTRQGGPWDRMQLGMEHWTSRERPADGTPVVITYNYYDVPALRYRTDCP